MINLPHPRMHKRNFVLLPLFEINKDWIHPIFNQNIKILFFLYQIETLLLLNKFELMI